MSEAFLFLFTLVKLKLLKLVSIRILTRFNQTSQLNRFNHIQHSGMSISTLVEFKSFKISYSIKKRTTMDETEEIILLTLILRRRRRIYHKRTYYTKTSTQPPLAQSSKNISHRHFIKPPQHISSPLHFQPRHSQSGYHDHDFPIIRS